MENYAREGTLLYVQILFEVSRKIVYCLPIIFSEVATGTDQEGSRPIDSISQSPLSGHTPMCHPDVVL